MKSTSHQDVSTVSTFESKPKASSKSFESALLLATHLKRNQEEGLITIMNQPTDKTFAQLRVEAENLGIVTRDNAKQGKEELKEAISKATTKDTNRGGGR